MKPEAKKKTAWATAVKMRTMFQDGCCRVWPDESLTLLSIESDFEQMCAQIAEQYDAGEVPDSKIDEALAVLSCHLNKARAELISGHIQSAINATCRAGATWMALRQILEWPKSNGRGEHPVWGIVRQLYAANKKLGRKHICGDAIAQWEKQTGKVCPIKVESMVAHFAEMI